MFSLSRSLTCVGFFIFSLCLTQGLSAQSAVDPTFGASLTKVPSGRVHRLLVQPDGKYLVAGDFKVANGRAYTGLVRLNPDGSTDLTFAATHYANFAPTGTNILDIEFQSDGKILVGGDFYEVNGLPKYRLVRLNTNGTVDETFAPQPITATVHDIVVLPDGKILVGGAFMYVTPTGERQRLVRLNADGTLDASINFGAVSNPVFSMVQQVGGGLVVTSGFNLVRYTAAGSIDPSFGPISCDNNIAIIRAQADGKLLVGGYFGTVNGFSTRALFRTTADGMVDPTFNNSAPDAFVLSIHIMADQRILIGGAFSNYNGVSRPKTAVLSSDGVLDPTYDPAANNFPLVNHAISLPAGKVLVGGSANPPADLDPSSNPILLRNNANGSIDNTFSAALGLEGIGARILVQPDGKIIAGGQFLNANGVRRLNLARFNADGTLDTGFGPPAMFTALTVTGLDIQPDGKILVVGAQEFNVGVRIAWRLNTDGTLNGSIEPTAFPRDVKVLPNGQILIANNLGLNRYNANLSLDSSFVANTSGGNIHRIALQPDGKILIAGTFIQVNGFGRARIARLNANGTVDTSFNPGSGANAQVNDIAVQADGKIIIGGEFTGYNFSTARKYLVRMNPDASVDTAYIPTVDGPVSSLKIQPNGKLLLGGDFKVANTVVRPRFARLNANGTLDPSFTDTPNDTVLSIDVQADGKIVYAGEFTMTDGLSTIAIGRLLNISVPARTPFDFDGDGRADISVFRSSTNRWYEVFSSTGAVAEETFGISGDILAPADFDGDGKTDEAIFRPSNGQWWYKSSISGSNIANGFGAAGDIPRPSDFDGDGKADLVLFRPSTNTWMRFGSNAGLVQDFVFGIAGDQPLAGDFDGDGRSDPAIFRPSSGDWWYAASSAFGAYRTAHWGQNGDVPVPADYDGDGKTDFAVFRPSDGGWYIHNSGNGSFTTTAFGTTGDRPVAGDYDGDGSADIAVFRPSTGIWYLLRSTAGFAGYQFGISSDMAIPGSLIP